MNPKKSELLELFNRSIDNAYNLYNSAKEITKNQKVKYPALGLAELALEELGKSFSCLAYYSQSDQIDDWKEFWKEWRKHDLKAHRAFFYEFFCLLRVEMDFEAKGLKFPSERASFSMEKEVSFYVDIDKGNRKLHVPEIEISDEECIRRVTSLLGLFNAAFFVKDWMNENSDENFRNAISDYAYRTISTEMYQQDVEKVLAEMVNENEEYNKALEKIKNLFTGK